MTTYQRFLARAVVPPRRGRFAALDGYRGLAAVGVLVFHAAQITGFVDRWFIAGQLLDNLGNFAVAMFFVLSGFVLYMPYSRAMFSGDPLQTTIAFLGRRFRRIYPGYWLALLGWALFASASDLRAMQPRAALFLVDGYTHGSAVLSGLAVAWSLRIEIAFYLVLPFVAALIASECRHVESRRGILVRQLAGITVLAAIAPVFRAVVLKADLKVMESLWLPAYLDWFALGMLLALLAMWREAGGSLPVSVRQFADRAWPSAIVAVMLYVAVCIVDGPITGFARGSSYGVRQVHPPLQALAAFFVLVPATIGRRDQPVVRAMNRPTLAALGAISYGFYLWHTIVLRAVHPRIDTGSVVLDMALNLVLVGVPTTIIATLSFRFVERPEFLDAAWWRENWRYRMWPITTLFTALASISTFGSSPGRYVADNRYEQFANPLQRLVRQFAVWDWTRGLGGPREDAWLGLNVLSAIPRLVGLPTWATERIVHVVLLVAMATGVVMVVREFERTIGVQHVIAGLLAAFGPFSASFLLPSSLYSMVALCPWLVVAVLRGTTGPSRWRWAAIVAVLVALAANPDIPGLLYNTIAVLVTCVYVVASRRARLRRVTGWLAITTTLTLAASAWMLTKTYLGLSVLRDRLQESELVATAAVTSSWSESVRGLGNWLTYFAWAGTVRKSATDVLLTNTAVVLATFVVPVAAFAMMALSRRRHPWFFGLLCIMSLTFVVGGYADGSPTPFGGWWLRQLQTVEALSSFRNTYKAAGGLVIASSVLAGLAVSSSRRALSARAARWRHLPVVLSLIVVGACVAPFATTSVYEPRRDTGPVPEYWSTAFTYLDGIETTGRSLFLPATSATRYRWGFVGDDILDAGLDRPHTVAAGVPTSPALANDSIETITMLSQTPNYRPGVLGPLAARLGITEIVLRNDIDWQSMHVQRPSAFDGVRSDPDFELVASIGPVGSYTTARRDASTEAEYEATLPPIEVYRLRRPTALVAVHPSSSPLIVAGSSASWPRLWTDAKTTQPIASSGALEDTQLATLLDSGSAIAITDTARMRLRVLQDYEGTYGYSTNLAERLDREPSLLYPSRPEAHSSTWFPDAVSISSEGIATAMISANRRPALAFDGDPETSWVQPWQFAKGGTRIRVTLREARPVGRVVVKAARLEGGAVLAQRIRLQFDGLQTREIDLDADGRGEADLSDITASSILITVTGFDIGQPLVGLAEVTFDNFDLREHIQVPSDLTAHEDGGVADELQRLIARAPTLYLFARSTRFQINEPIPRLTTTPTPELLLDEERAILRRFTVAHPGTYLVSGRYRLTPRLSEQAMLSLTGGSTDRSAPLDGTCRLIGLSVRAADDEDSEQIRVRLTGSVGGFLAGAEIPFVGCDPLSLAAGDHQLATATDAAVSSVLLASSDWTPDGGVSTGGAASASIDTLDSAAAATADITQPSTVVLATAFDPAWTASGGGRSLGAPLPIDSLNGWIVTPDDTTGGDETRMTFALRGETLLDLSIAVTSVGLILCLVIALVPRRRARHRLLLSRLDRLEVPDAPLPRRLRAPGAVVAPLAAGALSVLYIGPIGLVVVPVVIVVALRASHAHRYVGLAAAVLLAAAGVASVVGVPDNAMTISLAYARERTLANSLALSAIVFGLHTVALRLAADRQRPDAAPRQRDAAA